MNINKKFQEGQTILIVVLVMVIVLTVGLSVASRTITNLRTATEEANSAQAISAAEAGVQQVIHGGGSTGSFSGSNANFSTSIASINGTNFLINGGNIVFKSEGADVWLVGHNADGTPNYSGARWNNNLTIYWGEEAEVVGQPCKNAAIQITLVKGVPSTPASVVTKKYTADPCESRRTENNFSQPTSSTPISIAGRTFQYRYTIAGGGSDIVDGLVARVVPLYKNAILGAGSSASLPSQGSIISSTGTSANGEVKRKLNAFQGYSFLPIEFFSYGIFVLGNE